MDTLTPTAVEEAVALADFGFATARKTGRNPRWPYVPVVVQDGRQAQVLGRAYATRVEAVTAAQAHVEAQRVSLAAKLVDPRFRALREQHGLPREVTP